jgi:tetratricopeptide (TPR) repeat protein
LAWSENLLSPAERVLFRRLAVFAGGCTLEMAQAVCDAPERTTPLGSDLFDELAVLVDQSLVQQREEGDNPRFNMLHVIREYAHEQLEASGEAEALRRAHAAAMLALAERAEPELVGPNAGMWLDRLEREHDNVRAALGWARERGETETGLRLAAAVFRFWMVRGHLREGRAWVEGLLALDSTGIGADADRILARALFGAGVLAVYLMENDAAKTWLEEAIARGRVAGDQKTTASALSTLGVQALQQGNLPQAQASLEESLALTRMLGEQRSLAVVLTNLGIVIYNLGDLERAKDIFSQALLIGRQLRDYDLIATNLANLATMAQRQGEIAASVEMGREALMLYRDLGDPRRCAVGLEGLACSAVMLGQMERGARLLGAAATLRQALGASLPPLEQADLKQMMAPAQVALGEEHWAAAFTAGQALTLEAAIAEALDREAA